jgi:AraC-like DNA-binding protein/mannose-6-phosphate isomerase-like protein (cupin superfamily)
MNISSQPVLRLKSSFLTRPATVQPSDASQVAKFDPWERSTEYRGYEREVFEGSTLLLPELAIFGWLHFHAALPGALQPDRHEGLYEIHYMRRGHVKWWVEDEKHDFFTGSVFIVKPGELHGGEEESLQRCEHYWLRIGFPTGRTLPSLSRAETDRIRSHFESIRFRNFSATPEVGELFVRIHNEHRFDSMPHGVTIARAMLHALLIGVLRDHDRCVAASKQQPLISWRVRRVIELLQQRMFDPDLRIDAIAAEVGGGAASLRARFRLETGLSMHDFLLQHRIKEAKKRLEDPLPGVTQIAYDLGFSSSQYFATTFRRFVGMAPGEYRRKHGSSQP